MQPTELHHQKRRVVQTPFGEGVVLVGSRADANDDEHQADTTASSSSIVTSTRKNAMNEIQLTWNAKLYSPNEFPSVPLQVGQDVWTQFGRGTIIQLRESTSSNEPSKRNDDQDMGSSTPSSHDKHNNNTVVVVRLSSWRLAHRSRVHLYLPPNAIQAVLRSKQPWEMNVYEKVEFAQHLKDTQANPLFQQQQYAKAWQAYMQAVHVVKYVQHDAQSNNEVRADLIVLMITCCNNAALCAMHLATTSQTTITTTTSTTTTKTAAAIESHSEIPTKAPTTTTVTFSKSTDHANSHKYWEQVYSLAHQALALLDALHQKRGMKIHTILTKPTSSSNSSNTTNTCTDAKLFGEWRVKSLVLIAKALLYDQLEYDAATTMLKRAHDIVTQYTSNDITSDITMIPSLQRQDKEVRRLLMFAKEKKREIKDKEREWAKAMFASSSVAAASPLTSSGKKQVSLKDVDAENPAMSPPIKLTASQPQNEKKGFHDEYDDKEEKEDSASPIAKGKKSKAPTVTNANEKRVSFAPDVGIHYSDASSSSSSSSHLRNGKTNKSPVGAEYMVGSGDYNEADDERDDEEEEDGFLAQHEEALTILVLAAATFLAVYVFRPRR